MTLAVQANKASGMLNMYNYKCNGLPHGFNRRGIPTDLVFDHCIIIQAVSTH